MSDQIEQDARRPSLNWEVPYYGQNRQYQMSFGYFEGEPTAAVISDDGVILIPKDVLAIAYHQGW